MLRHEMHYRKQEAQEKQYNVNGLPSKPVRGILVGILAHVLTPGQKRQRGLGLE
jgi:hypothetical protein